MGSGVGLASGFGKLRELGFHQPVVAVIGDSTFYHAGIPPLINAKNSDSRYLCVILDNDTTAMTGHQPHPGSGITAMGEPAHSLPIPALISGLGIPVTVRDTFRVNENIETMVDLLKRGDLHVLVLRGECALKGGKRGERPRFVVDPSRCLGDACGCARLCSRVFSCPANLWDEASGMARIDEVLCVGCGVCAAVCPQGAIVSEIES
jgi:indolepyruvate ferredoxin oxidoreductase alpha subunit